MRALRKRPVRDFLAAARQNWAETTLLSTVLGLIIVLTLSSILVLLAEEGQPDANINSSDNALWWSVVTVATVGYGDYYPVTNEGRVVAIFAMVIGFTVFSVFTSYLASSFRTGRDAAQDLAIENLRTRLEEAMTILQRLEAKIQPGEAAQDTENSD
jgi:voltage-gated potassium channel